MQLARPLVSSLSNEIRRGMTFSVVEACIWSVWHTAVTGTFLTGISLHLGAQGTLIGLLTALPSMSTSLQLIVASFVRSLQRRRAWLASLCGMQRLLSTVGALVALWLLPRTSALTVFVLCQVVAWAAMAPYKVIWAGYMSDLVPLGVRGRYFATRSSWGALVALAAVMTFGWILDTWPGDSGFFGVFWIAFVAGVLNLLVWFTMPELPDREISVGHGWQSLKAPFVTRGPHLVAAIYFAILAAAQGLAFPFFTLYLVQNLGLSYGTIALLQTTAAVVGILANPIWGVIQDRRGDVFTLGLIITALALVPFFLLLGAGGGFVYLIIAHLLLGTGLSPLMVISQNLNIRLAPREDRSTFLAFFATVGGLTGFLTPIAVGFLTADHLPTLLGASGVTLCCLVAVWWGRIAKRIPAIAPDASEPA